MSTATQLRRGDRVELVSNVFGATLPPTSAGIVVEVDRDKDPERMIGSFTFPISVAFPALRNNLPDGHGAIIFPGLDTDNLHDGDVVPMMERELRVTGNIFDEGYKESK